ncbi:MAG: hypothetical protein KDD82_28130, partial [Planctomycetes bacterium]|nr:hypothetical protein [Planctomycetota bacterium]
DAATEALVARLGSTHADLRRNAAAHLIEGAAREPAASAAWDVILEALEEGDPRAQATLLGWALAGDLAPLAADRERRWLEGSDPIRMAWAAGAWVQRAAVRGPDGARREAGGALLRLTIEPSSLPARIVARRAFAGDAERLRTLEHTFGESGEVIHRGLVAALLRDPDGAWAAGVLSQLIPYLELDAGWAQTFASALPQASLPVQWQLVRALQDLGVDAFAAAPALRRVLTTTQDPALRLALEDALAAVLGA